MVKLDIMGEGDLKALEREIYNLSQEYGPTLTLEKLQDMILDELERR